MKKMRDTIEMKAMGAVAALVALGLAVVGMAILAPIEIIKMWTR